jgi:ATP-dependent DNA ligase
MQQSTDRGAGALVCFAFDLIELDGAPTARMSLLERKKWLAKVMKKAPPGVSYSEHADGDGERSAKRLAGRASRASFRSAATSPIRLATAPFGLRASASIALSS